MDEMMNDQQELESSEDRYPDVVSMPELVRKFSAGSRATRWMPSSPASSEPPQVQKPLTVRICEHCDRPIPYTRVELWGGKVRYPVLGCSCAGAQAAREAAEKARRRQERENLVADLIEAAGLNTGKWARMTLETWDPTRNPPHAKLALRAVEAYVAEMERAESNWLFLSGPYGTGKTHLALGTLRRLA